MVSETIPPEVSVKVQKKSRLQKCGKNVPLKILIHEVTELLDDVAQTARVR